VIAMLRGLSVGRDRRATWQGERKQGRAGRKCKREEVLLHSERRITPTSHSLFSEASSSGHGHGSIASAGRVTNSSDSVGSGRSGVIPSFQKTINFPSVFVNKDVKRFTFFGRPFVKRFALCYRTVVLSVLSVLSITLVYCGQAVGWIKVKLGRQVGLGSGHIVLDGDAASPFQRGTAPQFSAHICWGPNGWMD